jgi:hypothetical protein
MSQLAAPKSVRDGRLDVLRGLCLINMVLVHLIEQGLVVPWLASEVVMHWLRFAAGGFILTSGLCIGAIHYQKALDPTKRLKTHLSLIRRAGLVLLVHYFATFLSLLLVPIRGHYEYDTLAYIRDTLLLWTGYDLLVFYVVMLLASPILIEAIRRFGVWVVALASGALFFVAYDNPYLPLYGIENDFPVIRWQAVFVCGVLVGSKLPAFDAMSRPAKVRLMTVTALLSLAIAGLSAVERFDHLTLPWWLTVMKYPLSPLEVVRYLSIVIAMGVALDLIWKHLTGTRTSAVLQVIGAQSLLLWVAHVPIVANLTAFNWVLAIAIAVPAVWVVAKIGIWLSTQWADSLKSMPRLPYAAPVLGSLMSIAFLAQMQTTTRLVAGPDPDAVPVEATVTPDPADVDDEVLDIMTIDDDSVFETT